MVIEGSSGADGRQDWRTCRPYPRLRENIRWNQPSTGRSVRSARREHLWQPVRAVLARRPAPGPGARRSAAAGCPAARRPPGDRRRRGAGRRRAPQPRRRVLPPARDQARRRRRRGTPRGARDRRLPGQDAEPGDRVRRHAGRRGRRGRPGVAAGAQRGGPGGHARLALADAAADHRRAGGLGRALRAGARRGARHPLRPVDRRGPARTTCPASWPWPSWTSAAPPR